MKSLGDTLGKIFKQDSDLCQSSNSANTLNDKRDSKEEMIEMVCSILNQFRKSKEQHFKDVKKSLVKMEELQLKKNFYKKLSLKTTQKLKETEKELQEMKKKVAELGAGAKKEPSLDVKDLEEKVRQLEADNKNKDAEIAGLNQRLQLSHMENEANVEKIREEIKSKMRTLSRSLSYSVKVKDSKLEELRAENQRLAAVETELKNQVDQLAAQLTKKSTTTEIELFEKDKEINRLRKEVSRAIVNLESPNLKALKDENARLRVVQKEHTINIRDLEARLMTIKKLENTLKDKNTEIERLKRQVANAAVKAKSDSDREGALKPDHQNKSTQNQGLVSGPAKVDQESISLGPPSLKSRLDGRDAILTVAQKLCCFLDSRAVGLTELIRRNDEEHKGAINSHKANLMVMKEQVNKTLRSNNLYYLP